MANEHLIPVQEFCLYHEIEFSFIDSLNDFGLVEITLVEETKYIDRGQMKDLERMIRMHYDLDINIEGIDAIAGLLERMDRLKEEMRTMRNRLNAFEKERS